MPRSDLKEHAQALLERLPPAQMAALVALLETMLDPVSRAVALAPLDDQPLSEKGKEALEQAHEWLNQNKAIPHDQVLGELGITREEIEKDKEPA